MHACRFQPLNVLIDFVADIIVMASHKGKVGTSTENVVNTALVLFACLSAVAWMPSWVDAWAECKRNPDADETRTFQRVVFPLILNGEWSAFLPLLVARNTQLQT